MRSVGHGIDKLYEAVGAAAIFWRTASGSCHAHRLEGFSISSQDLFQQEFVLPAVAKIVLVQQLASWLAVFADFVARFKYEKLPGSFYMWWDEICGAFWSDQTRGNKESAENYCDLDRDDKLLVDAMFDTLCQILALPDDRTKACSLHGLGHLHHPGVQRVVQRFIDNLPATAKTPREIAWLEQCRDGTVM